MVHRYRIRTLIVALITSLSLILFQGCATDTPFAPDDPIYRVAPDQAITALCDAYESLSIAAYDNLLHPDYRFMFADPGKTPFDRADDMASTERMFSGVTRKNSRGDDAPGVKRIDFNQLEVIEDWSPVADGEVGWSDATGVMRARIRYGFVLHLVDGGRTCASGCQIVYAVPVKSENWDGSLYWRWQLLGQRDQ